MALDEANPQPPSEVLRQWSLTPVSYLGGRLNEQWLVRSGQTSLVLRRYAETPWADVPYELTVLRRLAVLGWPVPEPVRGPETFGRRTWVLFTWLPGASRPAETAQDQRERGRLLARFHSAIALLSDLGQRNGFVKADELVADPELLRLVAEYERRVPTGGHVMRWHLEWCRDAFARAATETLPALVIHSDFAPWNLLYDGSGTLSGVLDFEATHRNYRIADFALAWRGDEDEVIEGYNEVNPLSEAEWEMIVPTHWAWTFLGVKDALRSAAAGTGDEPRFAWQINQLMKRSPLSARFAPQYPGPHART